MGQTTTGDHLEELERRHTEEIARANAAIAAAQDRSYWLDRWQLDLNALMRRRGASELRATLRAARLVYRLLYDLRNKAIAAVRGAPAGLARAKRVVEQEREATQTEVSREDAVRRALVGAGLEPRDGDSWVRLPPGGSLDARGLPDARRVVLEAGDMSPGAVLAACTPDWRISLFLEGDPDVYVLERR
jgi:hypothetical protein